MNEIASIAQWLIDFVSQYLYAGVFIGGIICTSIPVLPSEVLFVANHAFDCIGAKAAGMQSAFINRRSRPFGQTPHQPDGVFKDMGELADVLCA